MSVSYLTSLTEEEAVTLSTERAEYGQEFWPNQPVSGRDDSPQEMAQSGDVSLEVQWLERKGGKWDTGHPGQMNWGRKNRTWKRGPGSQPPVVRQVCDYSFPGWSTQEVGGHMEPKKPEREQERNPHIVPTVTMWAPKKGTLAI
jgi:hypothetical protein